MSSAPRAAPASDLLERCARELDAFGYAAQACQVRQGDLHRAGIQMLVTFLRPWLPAFSPALRDELLAGDRSEREAELAEDVRKLRARLACLASAARNVVHGPAGDAALLRVLSVVVNEVAPDTMSEPTRTDAAYHVRHRTAGWWLAQNGGSLKWTTNVSARSAFEGGPKLDALLAARTEAEAVLAWLDSDPAVAPPERPTE